MTTMNDEVKALIAEHEAKTGSPNITDDDALALCKNKKRFPLLHAYVWEAGDEELLDEARKARVRSVIMRIKYTTEAGDRVRIMTHVPGTPGYQKMEVVASTVDLAAIKLSQLTKEIRNMRHRFYAFRRLMDADVVEAIDGHLRKAIEVAEGGLRSSEGEIEERSA